MSAYVVRFAKTGNPNGPGLPSWPGYTRSSDPLLDFTPQGRAVARPDPWGAEIDVAAPRPASPSQ